MGSKKKIKPKTYKVKALSIHDAHTFTYDIIQDNLDSATGKRQILLEDGTMIEFPSQGFVFEFSPERHAFKPKA